MKSISSISFCLFFCNLLWVNIRTHIFSISAGEVSSKGYIKSLTGTEDVNLLWQICNKYTIENIYMCNFWNENWQEFCFKHFSGYNYVKVKDLISTNIYSFLFLFRWVFCLMHSNRKRVIFKTSIQHLNDKYCMAPHICPL